MSTNNHCVLVGNLTADPELRFTKTGKAVVNFRIAATDRINRNGEWQDQTTFVNIVVFGNQAENIAASVSKGDRVTVTGALKIRSYERPGTDEVTYFTEILAQHVAVSMQYAIAQPESVNHAHSEPAPVA